MHPRPSPGNGPSPAEIYDAQFVPALFQPWARRVVEIAGIRPGQRVLDVACGTGVLACAAAARVGATGSVTGLDANAEMVAVARRKRPDLAWRVGHAEALPFPDASFDAVVSQFGLMFFQDRRAALREMMRVLRPGGRLVVAVCDGLAHSPGYAVLAELLQRLFGETDGQVVFDMPCLLITAVRDPARSSGTSRPMWRPSSRARRTSAGSLRRATSGSRDKSTLPRGTAVRARAWS